MRRLMAMVASDRIDLTPLVTHRFSLDDIKHAYELFSRQGDGVMKVALYPHGVPALQEVASGARARDALTGRVARVGIDARSAAGSVHDPPRRRAEAGCARPSPGRRQRILPFRAPLSDSDRAPESPGRARAARIHAGSRPSTRLSSTGGCPR